MGEVQDLLLCLCKIQPWADQSRVDSSHSHSHTSWTTTWKTHPHRSLPSESCSRLWHRPSSLGQVMAKFWNFGQFNWLNFRHFQYRSPHISWSFYTLFICQGRETETMELSYFVHKNEVKFIQVVPTHSSDFKGSLRFRN